MVSTMLKIGGMEKYKHELDYGQFITNPLIFAIFMKGSIMETLYLQRSLLL